MICSYQKWFFFLYEGTNADLYNLSPTQGQSEVEMYLWN